MPLIELYTSIHQNRDIVFDLSRSIDLHMISTKHTNEKAIAGRTSGLIEYHETVTWSAKHFGFNHKLTSKITEYQYPDFFVDEMVDGIFKRFRHEHHFKEQPGGTLMIDYFDYLSPLGWLGKCADYLFLEKYMKNFLEKRNATILSFAESERWKELLK